MGETNDILRVAIPNDFPELMRICRLLHAENGQHEWSEDKVKTLIWRGVNQQNAIIGVIGPSDDIKAMLYLVIDPIYYSDDLQLYEIWNYVREDSRRTDYAKKMIRFAKRCADETGLDLLIGIISDARLDAKQRLYERELPKGGVWFIYKSRAGEKQMSDGR